jgi:tungstate transport system ATP-binding protein
MELSIYNLIKEYDGHRVVDIDSLTINQGSLLGIIGPNGAGKSTLLRLIGGLEKPTSGEIYYDGQPFNPDIYKKMTVVFQKPYLLRTTVFQNVAYPLKIRKENKEDIKRKTDQILKEMGLEFLKEQKSWTLSGGEMQKVALARALIFKPDLLILDEPTANIDPSSIAVMERMIQKIHEEENTTIIIVTHNLQQAKRLCKEVAFMHKGRIEEKGDASQILYNAQKETTSTFIQGELLI